jgi:hypothetical protein
MLRLNNRSRSLFYFTIFPLIDWGPRVAPMRAALKPVRQLGVVQSQQVKRCSMKVVNIYGVFSRACPRLSPAHPFHPKTGILLLPLRALALIRGAPRSIWRTQPQTSSDHQASRAKWYTLHHQRSLYRSRTVAVAGECDSIEVREEEALSLPSFYYKVESPSDHPLFVFHRKYPFR